MTDRKLISLIIPVFNESENIDPLFAALDPVLERLSGRYEFEILFTDNHSYDDTFAKLSRRAESDARIRVIRLSRNFGFQRSILTGYVNARGAAAIQLDADLQDPPAMIADFLRFWEDGYQVVYGVRRGRAEHWLMANVRKSFYRFIARISENDLPLNAGDFRLVDRTVLNALQRIKDNDPYLRGIIAAIGFRQIGIVYDRSPRVRGTSKIPLAHNIRIAMDGIVSQSVVPLRLATYSGFIVMLITLVVIPVYGAMRIFLGADWPPGFTTTVILILFGIGLNASLLGIIGEYLARIYRQSLSMPITLIEAVVPQDAAARIPGSDQIWQTPSGLMDTANAARKTGPASGKPEA